MNEERGPVRHGSRIRRPAQPTDDRPVPDGGAAAGDLQATFAALTRRPRPPTLPGTRPADVLRAAGLPLLVAAMAATGPPAAVVAAAAANRRTLARTPLPTRDQAKAMVVATARALGVNPALALAVAYQESGFDQHQVSPANAVGVMQVTPSSGRWASARVGQALDLLNTNDNIIAGLVLLQALTRSSTESEAIAAYYQGLSCVRADGPYDDTRRFVAGVHTLKALFAAGGSPAG